PICSFVARAFADSQYVIPMPAPISRFTSRAAPALPGAERAAGSTCCLKLAIAASTLSGGVCIRVARMNLLYLLQWANRLPARGSGPTLRPSFGYQGGFGSLVATLRFVG